jgi:hypothetical protein
MRDASESASARIYGGLDRVAGFVRASVQVARATEQLAGIARQQMHIPDSARGLAVKAERRPELESTPRESRAGSETQLERDRGRSEVAPNGFGSNVKALEAAVRVGESLDRMRRLGGSENHLAKLSRVKLFRENSDGESRAREIDTTADSNDSFSGLIHQSALGMKALTQIQKSQQRFGFGNDLKSDRRSLSSVAARSERGGTRSWGALADRANRTLGVVGRLSVGNEESSPRFGGTTGSGSRAQMWSGPKASMAAPASLARPEFAEPMRTVHGQESRSAAGSITINSTPTVVINASEASGDVERQVIDALRTHRDELFDQFKRESIRRERAQF